MDGSRVTQEAFFIRDHWDQFDNLEAIQYKVISIIWQEKNILRFPFSLKIVILFSSP